MAFFFSPWAGPLPATSLTLLRSETTTRKAPILEVKVTLMFSNQQTVVGGCRHVHFADRAYRPSGCLNVQHRQWLLMPVLVWLLLALCNVGKQHVYNNGQLHWPNGRFGVCGDPWDSNKPLEKAGRVTGRQLRQQHI
jgi:hypothetical protein